jgi:3-dehydroquinate dehydratase / shikimate dehydrogenase
MARLCLTLAEASPALLQEKIERYHGRFPFIEIRLDYLRDPKLPALPGDGTTEYVATVRPTREGGRFSGAEGDRLALLAKAASSGFSWVDVEQDVSTPPFGPGSVKILRSFHSFSSFVSDLSGVLKRLEAAGGDCFKIAVSVSDTRQLVTLLDWMEALPGGYPRIVLGMGPHGHPSRILGAFLSNYWTFVTESEETEHQVAPGQLPISRALDWYRLSEWSRAPEFYGVIGNPIAHSLSPPLHNRLFQHYRLDKLYLPLLLDDPGAWFDYASRSRLSFQGFSVTLPFKTKVVEKVRTVDKGLAAINTVTRSSDGWHGLNTDRPGFLQPLQDAVDLGGKRAVVLGNGGVAHTVVAALKSEGVDVIVAGRDAGKVEAFARNYGCSHILISDLPVPADICINTTPVGQYPDLDASPLQPEQLVFPLVYDLVYHPERTSLLRQAAMRGARVLSGMEMFLEQAALQFQAWTGISPDRSVMRDLLRELNRPGDASVREARRSEEGRNDLA